MGMKGGRGGRRARRDRRKMKWARMGKRDRDAGKSCRVETKLERGPALSCWLSWAFIGP